MISVIIPHLNQPEQLRACLQSLRTGTQKPDEIIVVDNGSRTLPEAVCAEFDATLLVETTPGPGPARNKGVSAAKGDVLAFIDADCVAETTWLAVIAAHFGAHADAEILGGDVRILYRDPARPDAIEAYESIYAYRMALYIKRDGYTGTGNLAVRRAVIDKVGRFGGLDVAEDMDWGRRATGQGFVITYLPEMRIYHPGRENLDQLKVKWDRHTAHLYEGFRGSAFGRLKWILRAGAMVASPLGELPKILTSDRLQGAGARMRAFATLCQIRAYRARKMLWLAAGGDPEALTHGWNR